MEHIATLAIIWTRRVCSSSIHCLYLLPHLCFMNVNRGLFPGATVGAFTMKATELTPFKAVDLTDASPLATVRINTSCADAAVMV